MCDKFTSCEICSCLRRAFCFWEGWICRGSLHLLNAESPAELSFCGAHLPWQLSTPGAGDSWRRPRRSCAAAETGRGTAFALAFPISGSLRCPCSIGNEIQPAAGRNPASRVEILTPFGRNLCAAHTNDEAPKPFGFGASFTLAAIYSRGTCRPTTIDVLMFHFRVRNGTGWGHQAMTTRL